MKNPHLLRAFFFFLKTVSWNPITVNLFALYAAITLASPSVWGQDRIQVTPKDKCPVCGMFVAKYPDFVSRISFKDGSYFAFDGAKDLCKYYLSPAQYDRKKKRADIVSIIMTDYYRLTPIDGLKAWYVLGSDVYGPMGRELIPFEKEADAKEFLKDHQGERILRFRNITAEIVKKLD